MNENCFSVTIAACKVVKSYIEPLFNSCPNQHRQWMKLLKQAFWGRRMIHGESRHLTWRFRKEFLQPFLMEKRKLLIIPRNNGALADSLSRAIKRWVKKGKNFHFSSRIRNDFFSALPSLRHHSSARYLFVAHWNTRVCRRQRSVRGATIMMKREEFRTFHMMFWVIAMWNLERLVQERWMKKHFCYLSLFLPLRPTTE